MRVFGFSSSAVVSRSWKSQACSCPVLTIKSLHDVIIDVIVRIDADEACKVLLKDSVCVLTKKILEK